MNTYKPHKNSQTFFFLLTGTLYLKIVEFYYFDLGSSKTKNTQFFVETVRHA